MPFVSYSYVSNTSYLIAITHAHINLVIILVCIAQNSGRGKPWQIWQIVR